MSERKLASIQVINKLEPIEGADRIELARILGWHVIVKKGEFEIGDWCVYFEVDSLLPEDNPNFDFLKNSKGKIKAIKTKKMRGIYSQGLALPISIIPPDPLVPFSKLYREGDDVTEVLKVKKYDPVEVESTKLGHTERKGNFPSFIVKSDETRVQNLYKEVAKYAGKPFVVTEKVDGTSFTAFIKDGEFGICSRNMRLKFDEDSDNVYAKVARKYDLENKFKKLRETHIPFDFGIQGEILGPGIQGNKYKLEDYELRLFDFWNVDLMKDIGFFFSDEEEKNEFNDINLMTICAMLDVNHVPILDQTFFMIDNVDKLVEMSIDKSQLYDTQREGIVFRAKHNKEVTNYNNRISFKAINPEFLVTYKC